MAEGDGPEIIFDADMSRVNKAIDDLESKSRTQPIELAVAPTDANKAPGTRGAGPPTAINIMGQSTTITNPAWIAALQAAGVVPGGAGRPNARATAVLAGDDEDATAGGRRGGGGGRRGRGGGPPSGPNDPGGFDPDDGGEVASRRLYRGASLVYLTRTLGNFVGQSLNAGRQYNIASTLAGNDQLGEVNAQLAYRKDLVASGGFIGQAVGYLSDPSGLGEAGVLATLAGATALDRQTDRLRSGADIRRGLAQDSAILAASTNPVTKAVAQIAASTGDRIASIQLAKAEAIKVDQSVYEAGRAERKANREREILRVLESSRVSDDVAARDAAAAGRPYSPGNSAYTRTREQAEALVDQQNAAADAAARAGVGASGRRFDADVEQARKLGEQQVRLLYRDEFYRLAGVNSDILAQNRVSGAIAGNNPDQARVETLAGQGRRAVIEAFGRGESWTTIGRILAANTGTIAAQRAQDDRERANVVASGYEDFGVSRLLLARQPLEARIQAARNKVADAIRRDPRATPGSDVERSYQLSGDAEIAVIGQTDADTKRYRRLELTGEAKALALDLNYRPEAAEARRAAERAKVAAAQLYDQGDPDNARLLLQNAATQQEVRKKRILESVDAAEIDINSTNLNGPRAGEDIPSLLKEIANAVRDLNTAQQTGSAGGTITE